MAVAMAALVCFAAGFALVSLAWPDSIFRSDLLLKASLSTGYGLGIFSLIYFLVRVLGITHLLLVDLLAFALLLVAVFLVPIRAATTNNSTPPEEKREEPAWLRRTLTAAFTIALVSALYSAIIRALARPHGGGWDAFAIWNLHARFLFLGGPYWRDGFSPLIPWSHPDYPLLLPAAIAHFWNYLGYDSAAVPAIIGLVFTFSTVGVLFSALSILGSRTAAMLGSITLLSTPSFVDLGAWQYADVPLSFFYLATIVLLCIHHQRVSDSSSTESAGLPALAGAGAGFAAWTKNEGVLFLCAIVLAYSFMLLRRHRREASSASTPQVVPLLAAVAPIFLLIAYFKHFIAPPGDLFADPARMLHKLLDRTRYWAVIQWFTKEFFRFGHWLYVPATPLMVGYYFVADNENSRDNIGLRACVLALCPTLAGYFVIYLITPYDIYWHLRFSLPRLFLQLWPSAIFLYFLSINEREVAP